ncbi:MAG TPA: AI-2E family transporter [Arenimonas sp.]|uniref:AI-2E family transporter n=1 Tax=Arenimonas sp. TaxID=1872635 RepID=UPI002D803D10|nr:AI-2E family transporter [Arenimonas sp.]HEU0152306.1 AI-2E family transporter [Arenimonas sp.]
MPGTPERARPDADALADAAVHAGATAAAPAPSGHAARLAALRVNARLLWVLVLAVLLYTCYFASSLILPVVLAAFFAMLLSPLVKRAPLRWLPRGVAAVLLVGALLGSLGAVGVFVAGPAGDWASKVPFALREAAPKLKAMVQPLHAARRASASFDEFTEDDAQSGERVVVRPPSVDLLSATPRVLGSALAVILLTFTFLVYGDDLLRKLLEMRRTRAQKRLTAGIVQQIQSELSRYMLTISITAVALGGATALWLAWLGVEDPLLWGALAAALNLTPFVGPAVVALLLALVGLTEFDTVSGALLPAAGYLVLNGLESQLLTPMALGRTMKINPLAIILWLMLWGWLWGVIGLLVAVPMLVCLKIVASRVDGWNHWSRLLE